jgi:hypothetical protein
VALDHARRLAEDRDPIWPHRRYCAPLAWEVLRRVDGRATVEDITDQVIAAGVSGATATPAAIADVLRGLHADGFILFCSIRSSRRGAGPLRSDRSC